jgi:hypothetical protein
LGSSWSKAPATDVHARRADPQGPVLQVNVRPALSGDLSTPEARQREVPCVSIAVTGDLAQHGPYLIRSEGLELLGLSGHSIDQ